MAESDITLMQRMDLENARLRKRVAELELQAERLRRENDRLRAEVGNCGGESMVERAAEAHAEAQRGGE